MSQVKWFDRKFDFSSQQNIFPAIIERLWGTPLRLKERVLNLPEDVLDMKLDSTWSVKENIGHLIDSEPLWQGRLEDILAEEKYLRPMDLANTRTDDAHHNESEVGDLLERFQEVRTSTIEQLSGLDESDIFKFALHPRLEQPMRTQDLFLFVAEHDYHHLARITAIGKMASKIS